MGNPVGYQGVDGHAFEAALVQGMRDTAAWPAAQSLRAATRPALDAPPDGWVLDVGCGLADVLIDLAADRPDLHCVGVDVSEVMLAAARVDAAARAATIDLHAGSATALDHPDATFDVVRSERMLQWLDDPLEGLREMTRVLRPGGTLVAIDTDWRTVAMEHPDRAMERAVAGIMQSRPGAGIGGRLRTHLLDLGYEHVTEAAATAVLTDWDPDERPAPPGFLPPDAMAQIMIEVGGIDPQDAARYVDGLVDTARRGRFHVSLTMFAVTGRRPA